MQETIYTPKIIEDVFPNLVKLEWGGYAPEDAVESWGARAIWHKDVELLSNRMTVINAGPLTYWLNQNFFAYQRLERRLEDNNFTQKSEKFLHVMYGKFNFMCNPQGSFGYLYMSAWVEK